MFRICILLLSSFKGHYYSHPSLRKVSAQVSAGYLGTALGFRLREVLALWGVTKDEMQMLTEGNTCVNYRNANRNERRFVCEPP